MPRARRPLLNNQLVIEAKDTGVEGTRLRFKLKVDNGSDPKRPGPTAEAPKPETTAETESPEAAASEPKATRASKKEEKTALEPAWFDLYLQRLEDDGKWKEVEKLERLTFEPDSKDGGKTVTLKDRYGRTSPSTWVDIQIPVAKPSLLELPLKNGETEWHHLEFEESIPTPEVEKLSGDEAAGSVEGILETLDDVSIVCVPDLMLSADESGPDQTLVRYVQDLMISHCEKMGERVAILDAPPNLTPQQVKEWRMRLPDTSYAALYYPWIEILDPVKKRTLTIPPCGHMAGIWARSDNTRGVHKAPANEDIRFITGLPYQVTKGEQDTLNPFGINCLREFPGRGIRVWGARTVSSNPSWRYLNVRRLFNYVKKSIERSTQWVVFEPNDPDLWARVTRDLTAFLKMVWRSGALFGLTQEQAFYVKCDEELNPPESRDLGRLIVEIGLAPVKPAEFVIFRIMQTGGFGTE
ncbi:MAG: phage tail sheath subtilisin-like domain-containing protein [Anaerolineae bacterium]|nr:phage tail sheath subtilisin-like domain-containing protein [Anaerolineae bacterium]